jgi:hypothetical protein
MRRNEEISNIANVSCSRFYDALVVFCGTSAFVQERPYSEEHIQLHDGGDRSEYLQEMEHIDPWFYVPPLSDASVSTTNDNATR